MRWPLSSGLATRAITHKLPRREGLPLSPSESLCGLAVNVTDCHAPLCKVVSGQQHDIGVLRPRHTPRGLSHGALEPPLVRKLTLFPRLAHIVVPMELWHTDRAIVHVNRAPTRRVHRGVSCVADAAGDIGAVGFAGRGAPWWEKTADYIAVHSTERL